MRIFKTISGLLVLMVMQVSMLAAPAYAVQYEYVPGYGMMPVPQDEDYYPQAVDNSGTFGLSVDDFRYMCMDTGGEWDVVSGRHVCYCPAGEFNYPFGCPEVIVTTEENHYYDEPPYSPYPNDPYYPPYPEEDPYQPPPSYNYDYDYDYHNDYNDHDDGPFWDVGGHPDQYYIRELTRLGIIEGYPDGSFRPDQAVTRAEMAKMALMAANIQPLPCDEDRNRFFSDLDTWQAPWINAGYRLDIIEGYSGYNSGVRLYKPNNYVNRVEGVKLVLAAFGKRPLDFDKISFIDVYDWMVPWIEDAYRMGIIDDTPDMRFYPAAPMTRGMAARVIVRMLQYAGDI